MQNIASQNNQIKLDSQLLILPDYIIFLLITAKQTELNQYKKSYELIKPK